MRMNLNLSPMLTQSMECPVCHSILNKHENQATEKEIIETHQKISPVDHPVQFKTKIRCSKCGRWYFPPEPLQLPLQKAYQNYRGIQEAIFLYKSDGLNFNWTGACLHAKVNPAVAHIVFMTGVTSEQLEAAITDGTAESLVRAAALKDRFISQTQAKTYVEEHGKIIFRSDGNWRVIINVNGCRVVQYGAMKWIAVRDAAADLMNAFPSR